MQANVFVGSVMIVMFVNNYVMGRLDLYSERRSSSQVDLVWSIFLAICIDFGVLSAGVFMLKIADYSRVFLISFAAMSFIFISVARILFQGHVDTISKNDFNARRILIVGDRRRGKLVSELFEKQMSWGHKIIGRINTKPKEPYAGDTLGSIDDLPEILDKNAIDEVVFALSGDRSIGLSKSLDICRKMGVSSRILPSLWEGSDHALSGESFHEVPFLVSQTSKFSASDLFYKRIMDFLGGLAGMALLIIHYPFVAIAIKLESKGPVIFKQERIGKRGRVFCIYKFRSMYAGAEDIKKNLMSRNIMNGAIFKLETDPRITRVGKWLRKTSLDELPQFINVLKGEMSLVGTRPPTLDEVKKYQARHLRRISAKPGITGMWQISGRNKVTDFEQIVKLDLQYLDQWSFRNDIKILLKTIIVLLRPRGAM